MNIGTIVSFAAGAIIGAAVVATIKIDQNDELIEMMDEHIKHLEDEYNNLREDYDDMAADYDNVKTELADKSIYGENEYANGYAYGYDTGFDDGFKAGSEEYDDLIVNDTSVGMARKMKELQIQYDKLREKLRNLVYDTKTVAEAYEAELDEI